MHTDPSRQVEAGDHGVDELVAAFRDRTLPRARWTHEAHLTVAWATRRDLGDPEATADLLIDQIRAYNRCDTTAPVVVDCHQTLTGYYVLAVDDLAPCTLADVLSDPACSRLAPTRHWSPDALASPQARQGWVDPDRAPLPWNRPR